MNRPPTLQVEELTTYYATPHGWVHAVNGVSFAVDRGETLGIVGESGCGKSATVRSIIRLIRPPGRIISGSIRLEGRDLLGLSESEMRRIRGNKIGFVGQAPFAALNPVLTVGSQFRTVLNAHGSVTAERAKEIALARLSAVGIGGPEQVLGGYAHELSGGMAQRVVIAIAMLTTPALLIADEPTTALDVTVQRQVLDLIRHLTREERTAVLLVTHDLSVVAQYCDRVVVMYAGKVVEQGPVREIFARPAHPYTLALLNSVPRPGHRIAGLMGRVPDLIDYPKGCPYRSRCALAIDICQSREPLLERLPSGDREVSCHLAITDRHEGVSLATPAG